MTDEEQKKMLEESLRKILKDFEGIGEIASVETKPPVALMLPLSDGVRLLTISRTPASTGPFPTILMRSCYPHQEPLLDLYSEEFSKRGFAFVYQFCRGTGKSEGEWVPNIHERQDGLETLDWLSKQSWVENIGYWGCSYLAYTGWSMADAVPEKVKTLYLTHYGTDRFTSAYQSGLFRQDVLTAWAMENAGYPVTADYTESVRFRPQVEVDEKLWGKKLDWYRDWVTHTNREDSYWDQGLWAELKNIPSKVKVPVYIGEGWYDHHLGSALKGYEALSDESKAHSMLRIGAWNHGFLPCVEGIESNHLENSDIQSAFAWFDTILRKKQLPDGKVKIYQIGADRWLEKPVFSFDSSKTASYFLNGSPSDGKAFGLSTKSDPKTETLSYRYDPDNPVLSHGAESLLRTYDEIGSLRQPECGWRDDVLSFVSAPLENDIDILGKIQVKLFVSSTAEDTAFTAKLMEVYPDGKAYNIRLGITTLAYREGGDKKRMEYCPGTIVQAVIDFWDISWKLHKGSSLRLDISSSDSPQYSIHTNTAGIWALQDKSVVAEQTIHMGAQYPSEIILPVAE